MRKRNYTHVQALLPEIKAMLAEGKTQREIAEYYGFQDKQVVKSLLKRAQRKNASWKLESSLGPKDVQLKTPQEMAADGEVY